ncbi:MAG: hypothetical protein J5736_02945, partial [Bacilli bacterium]|nr:hypothetical protein [Bacilli bacterium]
ERATDYVFGDGYFCEINPSAQTVGYPPYISAHGAFSSAFLNLFADFSIWGKEGKILLGIPESFRNKAFSAKRILNPGNILLEELSYSPSSLQISLIGPLEGYELKILKPIGIRNPTLSINGCESLFQEKDGIISLRLRQKRTANVIISEKGV